MPTKRRFVLFLVVLIVMLLIKYAVGQEVIVWEPRAVYPADDIAHDAIGACLMGIGCGVISGFWRVAAHRPNGDLVMLRIQG